MSKTDPPRNQPSYRGRLLATVRAGVAAAVGTSDYVDLPPELVSQRTWNQARHTISDTFGAPAQAHELLRQYNRHTNQPCTWERLIADALRTRSD